MKAQAYTIAALIALLPSVAAASNSLRGSPASMSRQHSVAVEESLTFYRTPDAVLKEVAAGTLTPLEGNDDYRMADVSFAYAVPEVRVFVERLAQQYRGACGERLVVTSLTRPKAQQPRNAHALSVHPAGMAVDLRISQRSYCRSWLENTLLSLEGAGVLDVTRERMPPHYHVAVFPSAYRAYVARLDANKPKPEPDPVVVEPVVTHAAVTAIATPASKSTTRPTALAALLAFMSTLSMVFVRRRRRLRAN